MTYYSSIRDIKDCKIEKELVVLLKLLEEVNPCSQSYDIINDSIVISYYLNINLLNFLGRFKLNVRTRIIGLPISLCEKGYYGNVDDVFKILENKKGLSIILNAESDLGLKGRTLSSFIFYNEFNSFDEYIGRMRHNYRRRINKALKFRDKLIIRELNNSDFSENHYFLYESIMDRTDNPLEKLRIEFFIGYDTKIYEFLDRETQEILCFVQLKKIDDTLNFMFCGFKKEDNDHYDIYLNMLLRIVEEGISLGVKKINFGQTSEETKLKIGCKEEAKYLGIYHSNRLLNRILQLLLPLFSYRPYKIRHNVFKEDES